MPYEQTNHYFNRELSWLDFNRRVMRICEDESMPLGERLKFAAIYANNLDEFMMVRVSSLIEISKSKVNYSDICGFSAKQQLRAISMKLRDDMESLYEVLRERLLPELLKNKVSIVRYSQLDEQECEAANQYFMDMVLPLITPIPLDREKEANVILNKSLYVSVCLVENDQFKTYAVAVPSNVARVVKVGYVNGDTSRYVMIEDIIRHNIHHLFTQRHIYDVTVFRVTRSADLKLYLEDGIDILNSIEKHVKDRKHGRVVRMEVDSRVDNAHLEHLMSKFKLKDNDIFLINGPLDLTFLFKILDNRKILSTRITYDIDNLIPEKFPTGNVFEDISRRSIMLMRPYESFSHTISFIAQAAKDPNVLAIKITLYRVGKDSPVVKELIRAAEDGKQVTVLVELMARFDEENNISWARKLEKAGCQVVYGVMGIKTHSKICLVVRKENNKLVKYVHLSTGNYNDVTSRLYTDIDYFTCDEGLGSDAVWYFNIIAGNTGTEMMKRLSVSPYNLKDQIVSLIGREAESSRAGQNSGIFMKVNSISSKAVIDALYAASQAGVRIDLVVRGICCLRPGIPGLSENIHVTSIVGDFLEHSRLFWFENGGDAEVYITSADMMDRNLSRRFEILCPLLESEHVVTLKNLMTLYMMDNKRAHVLSNTGAYLPKEAGEKEICSQRVLERIYRDPDLREMMVSNDFEAEVNAICE